jgi:subtilisin family serine protease
MILRSAIGWMLAALLALLATAASAPAATSVAVPPEQQILVMVQHEPSADGAYGGSPERNRLARQIAQAHGLSVVDAWPMTRIGLDCFVMAVPVGHSTATAADEVSKDPNVQWAEPVAMYEAQGGSISHNDALFAAQPAARQWHLAELHQVATGKGVKVAIIDSGIEGNHPDLAGQLSVNRNFVASRPPAFEQHGTGVAGIIAAKADNRIGISGVAPGARVMGLRACWQVSAARTVCDSFSVIKALYFAIDQKADVINMSISGPDNRLMRTLVDLAIERGSTIVAAFNPKLPDGGFPASVLGVIAVSDAPAGGHVFVAPGRDIPTTQPGDKWFVVSGNSFAAAHVSGLMALLREKNHSSALVTAAAGRIDACASVNKAWSCECACGRAGMISAHR